MGTLPAPFVSVVQGWHIYDNPIEGKLAHDNFEVCCCAATVPFVGLDTFRVS
jgi:hypothetical protein